MGWNISHQLAADDLRRSYTSITNLGLQVAHVLPARQWRQVRTLFGRRSGAPFTVKPKDAREMARVLNIAAGHSKMPADWAQLARQLANSAQAAADTKQPWSWR